jgi:hypothetical protein
MFRNPRDADEYAALIQRSDMWPTIVAALNVTAGENNPLVIGAVQKMTGLFNTPGELRGVELTTQSGMRVAQIRWVSDKLVMQMLTSHDTHEVHWHGGKGDACSKNPKYIARLLKKDDSELRNHLKATWQSAQRYPNRSVGTMMRAALHKKGSLTMHRHISLTSDAVTALARLFMGDTTKVEMPSQVISHIESQYERYTKTIESIKESLTDVRQMFERDKWMVFMALDGGMSVAAISRQPFIAAIDKYIKTSEIPDSHEFSYIDALVPFKWYPSLQAMPDEMRQDIEMQLTMFKLHTNSTESLLEVAPEGNHSFPDIGVFSRRGGLDSPLVLLDRTV